MIMLCVGFAVAAFAVRARADDELMNETTGSIGPLHGALRLSDEQRFRIYDGVMRSRRADRRCRRPSSRMPCPVGWRCRPARRVIRRSARQRPLPVKPDDRIRRSIRRAAWSSP
jgi:hypothetical protein